MKYTGVRTNINQYYFAHGKKPRGTGTWIFEVAGTQVWVNKSYTEARKTAEMVARQKGVNVIKLLS